MSHDKTRPIPDNLTDEDRVMLLSRYLQLRTVSVQLNMKLVKRLSKDVLNEGAKKLGMFENGTFVFDSMDQTSVLMDYCIYNVYRKGRNAVAQYLQDSSPPPNSDEMLCLEAMQGAIYSLFVVESVIAGLGVAARDLRSSELILLADQGLSKSAHSEFLLASRILTYDDFSTTTGAALPLGVLPKEANEAVMKALVQVTGSNENGGFDPATLIRFCLERGASSHVRYEDPSGGAIQQQLGFQSLPRRAKPGRNAPCPCGSGKKYKHCCLK